MHFVSRLFLSIFCLWLTGCSVVPNELKTVESIMETHPDSALHILQHLTPDKYKSESNRALYGLLLFHALDKNDMKMQPDSLIDFSISYYLHQNDNSHLAACYFYKGHMFMHAQCYDKAKALYLKALDNLQNNKDYTLLGKIYADMGDISAFQLDYQESMKKNKLSLDFFNRAGKTIEASYVLLSIGRT